MPIAPPCVGSARRSPRRVQRCVRARGADRGLGALGHRRLDRGAARPRRRRVDEQHRPSALAERDRLGDDLASVIPVGALRGKHEQVDEVHPLEGLEPRANAVDAGVGDADRHRGDAAVLEEALQGASERTGMQRAPQRVLVAAPAGEDDVDGVAERALLGEPDERGHVGPDAFDRSCHEPSLSSGCAGGCLVASLLPAVSGVKGARVIRRERRRRGAGAPRLPRPRADVRPRGSSRSSRSSPRRRARRPT